MPLNAICERILADARSESARVEAQAKKGARLIIDQAEEEARAFIEASGRRALQDAMVDKKQKLAAAGLAARDSVIAAKQEIIGQAFAGARSIIEGFSTAKYIETLARLITAHASGGEEVVFDAADAKIADGVVKKANEALSKKGAGLVTPAADTRKIGRGFILRQGKVEENFGLDTLMRSARDDFEADIAEMIFGASA